MRQMSGGHPVQPSPVQWTMQPPNGQFLFSPMMTQPLGSSMAVQGSGQSVFDMLVVQQALTAMRQPQQPSAAAPQLFDELADHFMKYDKHWHTAD